MTPAKLQDLARQAGAIRLIDAADPRRKTPWSLTDAALARFAALIRAAVVSDAVVALDALPRYSLDRKAPGLFGNHHGQWVKAEAAIVSIRALAQQAGGEQGAETAPGHVSSPARKDAKP